MREYREEPHFHIPALGSHPNWSRGGVEGLHRGFPDDRSEASLGPRFPRQKCREHFENHIYIYRLTLLAGGCSFQYQDLLPLT